VQTNIAIVDIQPPQLPCHVQAKAPDSQQRHEKGHRIATEIYGQNNRQRHKDNARDLKAEQPAVGRLTKQAGSGFNADQGIVIPVLMGVDCIIKQGPGDARKVEQSGASVRLPVWADQPSSAPQLKATPKNTCGHHVNRLAKG